MPATTPSSCSCPISRSAVDRKDARRRSCDRERSNLRRTRGHHAATLYAYYFPVTAPRSEHGRLKDLMAERVIEKVTRYAPNFREAILHQATFAPYHYESMFGCTNGDFTHGLIHPDQLLEFRPVLGSEGGYRTPIPGLYMCGSSCYPGPGVTFLPGYNCAHIVLEDVG